MGCTSSVFTWERVNPPPAPNDKDTNYESDHSIKKTGAIHIEDQSAPEVSTAALYDAFSENREQTTTADEQPHHDADTQRRLAKILADYESQFEAPLPEGWETRVRSPDGRIYFADHKAKRCTFLDPRCPEAVAVSEYERKATEPLPTGWQTRATKEGRIYFADHEKRRNMWTDPRSKMGKVLVAHEAKFEDPLPEGWQAMVTDKGKVYYSDHNTKATTWNRPKNTLS